jgi:hypothetical protein
MIAYAFLTPDGRPTGGGSAPALPDGAVPLTEPWTTADLPRLQYRAGVWELRFEVDAVALDDPGDGTAQAAAVLAKARAAAAVRINARTDAFRRRFYTAIAGQDALYLEKRAEALAYIREAEQAGEPGSLEDYPLLAGEVGITAPTPWQLAQVWLHLSAMFKSIGATTERPRQIAMNAIADAPDEEAIWAVEATFAEALNATLAAPPAAPLAAPATKGP